MKTFEISRILLLQTGFWPLATSYRIDFDQDKTAIDSPSDSLSFDTRLNKT